MICRLSELAASTLPVSVSLPEEHQKPKAAQVVDDHHVTPPAPKPKPVTEVSFVYFLCVYFFCLFYFLFQVVLSFLFVLCCFLRVGFIVVILCLF